MYKAERQLQCTRNNLDSIGILQSLCKVSPMDACIRTERPLHAYLSGLAELLLGLC